MKRYPVSVLFLVGVLGCGGHVFTNLGNGVGVPSESIAEYAARHGVTGAEARAQMRIESDRERIREHAEKYGLSLEEAQRQLQHGLEVQAPLDDSDGGLGVTGDWYQSSLSDSR